jgi:putative ABC transport system permease protein
MHDLRDAFRSLRASPIVSAAAVLSLALGIGANTAIFSVVNSLLLRPLPVADPGRLVTISSDFALSHGFKGGLGWNYPMWLQLQSRAEMFGGVLAWSGTEFDLATSGEKQSAPGMFVSGNYFSMLGVRPRLGRLLTAADDVRGGTDGPVAVISDRFWARRFDRSAGVIGSALVIDAVPFTIVGVTAPGFSGTEVGRAFDVALPLGTEPMLRPFALDSRRRFSLAVMLRLGPDQSIERATAILRASHADLLGVTPEQLPNVSPAFLKEPLVLVPAATGTGDGIRKEYEQPILTIFAVAGLVLLVACVNIANLLIARATARRYELGVRVAIGASRWRLGRQLLVESLLLAACGACLGVLFAVWGNVMLEAYLASSRAGGFLDLSLDWRVLAFASASAMLAALLFGTIPAIRAGRVSPLEALRAEGRGTSGMARPNLLSGLVVGQIAVSLIIIVTTGLLVGTFDRLAAAPVGFDSGRVLIVNADLSRAAIDPAAKNAFAYQLVEAVARVPGVEHAAASRLTPLSDASNTPISRQPDRVLENVVTPGWFATYGTGIRAGRDLEYTDTAGGPPVALVNEAYARKFLADRNPLGATAGKRTIVGVVGDAVFGSVRAGMRPTIYLPLPRTPEKDGPPGMKVNISVRSSGLAPLSMARSVGAALTAVDPDITYTFRPLQDYVDASIAQERLVASLSTAFGLLGLLLAGLGLYGVTSYTVSRRRHEIGVRLALGATPAEVVRAILTRVSFLVAAGIAIGMVASLWLARFVAAMLYGVEPRDTVTLAGATVVLAAVGFAAGWVPARRASAIDPAEVLRSN